MKAASFLFVLLFVTNLVLAQEQYSIQINGGLIAPMSSSKGFTGLAQLNYTITPNISLYIYSGYSGWDQHKVVYHEDYSTIQKEQYFDSYSADEHTLIPVYVGSKIHLLTNKLFTSFINVELGYSHLSYNSYDNWKSVEPATGKVLGYFVDRSSKKEIKEDLFGVGVGLGFSHPITEKMNLILSLKLNSYVSKNYYGLFSTGGTYTNYLLGFEYTI
jgi:hypothetical protein